MGKINLNSFVYNEKITKEDIIERISQEEIYSYYIGEPIVSGVKLNSPLRKDNVPSFAIYYHKSKLNTLMYYDFATKQSGDCISFVCRLFNLKYGEALFKIAYDFNLSDIEVTSERKKIIESKKIVEKEPVNIGIKQRNWEIYDKDFWTSFGITKATLKKYNVVPISYVFFNGDAYKAEKYAYAYLEFKDEQVSYKIYQPFSKTFKWINNANYTVHQGYTKLPATGELIIITKSLKDVMSIHDCVNIPAIGLQSESVMMKDVVMNEYKNRFKKVICLFDNDAAGISLSTEFSERYKVPYILIPKFNERITDFSDMIKEIGKNKGIVEFNKLLKND